MKGIASFVLAAAIATGATTTTWEMNGYQDFLRGRIEGLSLTRDGRLVLGPKLDRLFESDQAEIWSVARAPDGSLYLGTGNRGRLYKLDAAGNSTLVWTADQPEIFAVAVDSKGVVYAGTSPDGKVYRIESGKATEYFAPDSRYIWALAMAPDGALMVGTGDQGKIFRVVPNGTGAGRGELYYDTGQANVTSLALDAQGRLLAGSEPNGLLYRITAPQKAFVLYHSSLPEIHGIIAGADGAIYAAALGGGVARRTGAAASSSGSTGAGAGLPTVTTSITVTDSADQQAGVTPPKPEATKAPAPQVPTVSTSTSTVEYAGAERSAVYKISADNTVETLWSSKDENVYDLALSGPSVVFITDEQGRIYRLDADRRATLVAQTGQGDATRLLASPTGLLAATGNLAMVLRVGNGAGVNAGPGGWFESPVHDAGTVARWGRITWRDATARGVSMRTRSGNSARPDATWSDWSEPITASGGAPISSPNARYIQWRAELSPGAGAAPSIENVTVAFLPQNTPPVVRSISVIAVPGVGKPTNAASSTASAYSVTVTDTGEAPAAAGTSAQTISRAMNQQLQIVWQADDPDGDRLLYSLYFRGEDESQWKLLRSGVSENTYALDGDQLADGRYYFRVTASDRPSNPAELAREAELVSAPVLIDNTPPVVTASLARTGAAVEITVDADDRVSALRRCEYSVDAGPWLPVEAADGVTDSPRERFLIRLSGLPAGEHLVAIRVYDTAGNAGLAKVVVR
jgi:WD40 repeat protein